MNDWVGYKKNDEAIDRDLDVLRYRSIFIGLY